ncbi:MAG TPA: hypothetical protein VG937_20245 [Polyangiaceae bacterium]|jgi:hypothetical protein|nr:hypothetical protein [Polyangiaceae bacterium]
MRAAVFSTLVLLFSTAGCASDRDAIDKRMAGLRDDITRLQAENDRLGDRVDALEVKNSAPASKNAAPAPAESKVERAPLKVVKLLPGEAPAGTADAEAAELAADERPDAPGTRPVIRLRGKDADSREGRSEGRASSKRQNSGEDSP